LPHPKLTPPLNTVDDQYHGKVSMDLFSHIQSAQPNSNVHRFKAADISYSEPNPNHYN
jgi:hypothetical protein